MNLDQALKMAKKQIRMMDRVNESQNLDKVDQMIKDKIARGEMLDSFEYMRAREVGII